MVNVIGMQEMRNAYGILVKKSQWKIVLKRFRCGLEDHFRIHIREECVDWIELKYMVYICECSNEQDFQ